jgi:hypothetical protein
MRRASSNLRAIIPWTFLTLTIALLACQPASTPAPMAGPLPRGVSSNPRQFVQQVSSLRRGDTIIRHRPGRCLYGECSVEIVIEALGTVLPRSYHAPDQGFAYAHIRNTDTTHQEAKYRLDPTSKADYYIWMDSLPGFNRTRWTLLRVPKDSTKRVENRLSKPLTPCHPGPPGMPAVDFAEYGHKSGSPCRVATNEGDPGVSLASSVSSWPFAPFLKRVAAFVSDRAVVTATAGAWFGCDTGCCR